MGEPKPSQPLRGDAAWKANKAAIASRNEEASKAARARRQEAYDQQSARIRAADLRERSELSKHQP